MSLVENSSSPSGGNYLPEYSPTGMTRFSPQNYEVNAGRDAGGAGTPIAGCVGKPGPLGAGG